MPTEEEEEEEEEVPVNKNDQESLDRSTRKADFLTSRDEIGLFWRHMIPFGCFILALGGGELLHILLYVGR